MIEKTIKDEYKLGTRSGITELDDCFYIPVRITGTGLNLRNKDGEVILADRGKNEFMSAAALEHYKTLPILAEHPKDDILTPENLKDNPIIGNCIDAWIQGDEVWGIARVIDKSILEKINSKQICSTSPGVTIFYDIMSQEKQNEMPVSINHLAFCEKGHWDSPASEGFDNSNYERITMEKQNDAIEQKLDEEVKTKADDAAEEIPEVSGDEVEELGDLEPLAEEGLETLAEEEPEPLAEEEAAIIDEDCIEEITTDTIEEVSADEAETEVIDSETETEEDKARDNACADMRKACDSAHVALGVVMPHLKGRQTLRSAANKFLQANRRFVSSKYANLALDSFTDELALEVLNDSFENIKKESKKLETYNKGDFVESGEGYSTMKGFGWANR